MSSAASKRTNILTFDGGGVRGLSSLIILRRLMKHVNQQDGLPPDGLTPRDLFALVAGTSTGGLIALMLGRFGMSVDDCITQYWTFSKEIFGHYSKTGKFSWGLLKERYDGARLRNSVRKLAARKDTCDNESILMQGPRHENGIPCTVLAAEFDGDNIRDDPAYLCSHDCDHSFKFRVCDAAQATTAAPSYFPLCRIGDRNFIDGGFGHNNPSFDIYTHYKEVETYDTSQRVDMNKILVINIGTGVDRGRIKQSNERQRPQSSQKQAKRHRKSLTGFVNLLRQMKYHTTNAQAPFYVLKAISHANEGTLDVHRFTADTGLHKIKLDKYRELKEIERLTNEYVDRPEVDMELIEVAIKLVQGWKEQNILEVVQLSISNDEIVPAPRPAHRFPPRQGKLLPDLHQGTASPRDESTPEEGSAIFERQDPFPLAPTVPGSAADITPSNSPVQPNNTSSLHQPSLSTVPGSTLGADTLGEDMIDIDPASDRVEPSGSRPLSVRERMSEPLPDTLSPHSAHPTGSLNGTTPESSPSRFFTRKVGLYTDINNKEVGMALGGQFAAQESS